MYDLSLFPLVSRIDGILQLLHNPQKDGRQRRSTFGVCTIITLFVCPLLVSENVSVSGVSIRLHFRVGNPRK